MTEHLLASLGLYGGTFAVAVIAGLFPIASIELFLIGIAAWQRPSRNSCSAPCPSMR